MTNVTFKLGKLFPGSDKQKAVGIYARFSLDVVVGDETIITLYDMKLSKSKEGNWYINIPYQTYNSGGEDKKAHYYRLFPNEKNSPKMTSLVETAKRELENQEGGGGSSTKNSSPSAVKTKPAAASSGGSDPW